LRQRLEAIRKGGASGAQLCEQVLGAMRDYLGDKLSTAGSTLTTGDAVRILEERRAPQDAIGAMREVLSSCEAGAYAGDHSPAADTEAFIRRALEAVRILESAKNI